MAHRFASLILLALSLCFATSVKAQVLVGTSGGTYPFGCVTIFTPLSVNVPIQGQTSQVVINDSNGDGLVIPPLFFTLLPTVDVLECAQGVEVDAFGILKASGGYKLPDGTTLTSASQLAAPSGSHLWSSFALAFIAPYTISTFTPDNNITVTRIQAQIPIAPSNCQTNAVIQVSNGASTASLTLSALANDSGSLATNFSSGTPITLKVSTPAACWGGIPPAAANIVVQYKVTG